MDGADGFRQPRIVPAVIDGLVPARLVREQMISERLVRERKSLKSVVLPRVEAIFDVSHPQRTPLAALVDQPDAAAETVGLLDHVPGQSAEEAFDVGFPHQ